MLHTKFKGMKILKGFYSIWVTATLFLWLGSFEHISFPHPEETPYEIRGQFA